MGTMNPASSPFVTPLTSLPLTSSLSQLAQTVRQALAQKHYAQAAALCEQAIAAEPGHTVAYWYLGLALLLQGQELEAQATWLAVLAEVEPDQEAAAIAELAEILRAQATHHAAEEDYQTAWLIRSHLRELLPTDGENVLILVQLAIAMTTFTGDDLDTWEVAATLQAASPGTIVEDLLLSTLDSILEQAADHPAYLATVMAAAPHVSSPSTLAYLLVRGIVTTGYQLGNYPQAIALAEAALTLQPDDMAALGHLAALYQKIGRYDDAIATAKRYRDMATTRAGKTFGHGLLLRFLMTAGGLWTEAYAVQAEFEASLQTLFQHPEDITLDDTGSLFTSTACLPYLHDRPQQNRQLHNQLGALCQQVVQRHALEHTQHTYYLEGRSSLRPAHKPLKIGYISGFLKRHSVGWLARWLFQYHDPQQVQVHVYLINLPEDDLHIKHWFADFAYKVHHLGTNYFEIADRIYQDDIDLLIDVDSITLDITCQVMALKPAPVQATWLGWDASGIPTVDYFIADPYVLPENAQDYHSETIWRLPRTYVAVDGFELGVPTLRRDRLNIPSNAIVYLSGQKGHKRHPNTVRLQMRILSQVPNSYFLIKGVGDAGAIREFFTQVAEEEGVGSDRLRFLPEVAMESIHRANLGIADVILDTYPYNGATTTLETLWVGVPLVTRVGQQFSARNSYGMMVNAGITEGIAWTDDDYVEWGVRLGSDPTLRHRVTQKLWAGRQTAPLWNTQQFTRDMEQAYYQMWQAIAY